ncbi:MAG: TetR/AcrR family transcriptional regulator [Betaproteobacteria bacterium]
MATTSAPRIRDARRTRERILAVATQEFAAYGYDGARVDAIVKRCRMSKNLLYHYFDGKEALFIEVMERAYASMRTRQNEVTLTGRDPRGDMRALVVHMVQHFAEEPEFISLLSTENLHKARHIRKSKVIADMFNPLIGTLKRLVRQGQQLGVFREDADWVDLYISISGLASYFISNRYTLSTVLDVDLTSAARMKRRLQHVPDVVLSYLCNTSEAVQRPKRGKVRN